MPYKMVPVSHRANHRQNNQTMDLIDFLHGPYSFDLDNKFDM